MSIYDTPNSAVPKPIGPNVWHESPGDQEAFDRAMAEEMTTHPVLGEPIGIALPMAWTEKDQQLAEANATIERFREQIKYKDEVLYEWMQKGKDLTEALTELVHLHGCEQEGLQSGKPTPEQWFNAVNKAHDVLWPKTETKPE